MSTYKYKLLQNNKINFYYANVGAPKAMQVICGVNCNCSKNPKIASEKSVPGYEFIKVLSKGGFGNVHLYRDIETGGTVVIKSISYEENGKCIYGEVSSEYDIVLHISHPNITKYYKFFSNPTHKICYLVMEYASRGSLRNLIENYIRKQQYIEPRFVLKMIHDVVSGVHYLNAQHVVHCDLKPENILIGDDNLMKICDFGTAHFLYDVNARLAYTLNYIAPEQFHGVRPNEKTEVWAIGIILYELCALQHPFGISQNVEQLQQKQKQPFAPLHQMYGKDMQSLVRSMLYYDHQQRETLAKILKNKLFQFRS